MSRTLFWYIFWDLLRIFGLASGAIAGILSFGGLLRPLTEHGLDASQVGRMLSYFMPAMTTYSLPIAALFATTVVYGRLAADNEITACRASGISHLSIATPAFLLGLIVAIVSLLFLCFIVPAFLLRIERVIYSNLADLTTHEIQRSHQVTFKGPGRDVTVFAQDAHALPPEQSRGGQAVVLIGPTVVTYERDPNDKTLRVPKDFMTARRTTVYIRQNPADGRVTLEVDLRGGTRFPREFAGAFQAGIESQPFRMELDSPIRFRPKFMDIFELKRTLADRAASQRIQSLLRTLADKEERLRMIGAVANALNGPARSATFTSGATRITIDRGPTTAKVGDGDIVIPPSPGAGDARPVTLSETSPDHQSLSAKAKGLRLSFGTVDPDGEVAVTADMQSVVTTIGSDTSARNAFSRSFSAPVPPNLRHAGALTPETILDSPYLTDQDKLALRVENLYLGGAILGELHSRASFAVSCLILVMVGCALGMMFKSGNFLSAFAVSVIPALLCVTLIIAGQHQCENVPWDLAQYVGPGPGIALIWSGNVFVAILATILLGRLQRQ